MRSSACLSTTELRASVLEVVDVCPVDQCNPVDCPLFEARKLPREERLRWIDSLSTDDLKYLVAYHHVCMDIKVRSRLTGQEHPA